MLPLILHHQRRALRNPEKYKALANCHVKGLHSVVLHDEPENRIRIFYADKNHLLYKNRDELSLAIHPHHCDITLVGLFGCVYNDRYAIVPHPDGTHEDHLYQSAITNSGSGWLRPTGNRAYVHRYDTNYVEAGKYVEMNAAVLHTIYVAEGREAAWMVIEGQEDPHYRPRCWTNGSTDLKGLYIPMVPTELNNFFTSLRIGMEYPSA